MTSPRSHFEVVPFAGERRTITAALDVGARRHMVHALLPEDQPALESRRAP